MSNKKNKQEEFMFLPNFCSVETIMSVIIMAELLSIAISLTTSRSSDLFFYHLGIVSLFVQWIALLSTILLCVVRKWFNDINNAKLVVIISYVLLIFVSTVVSEISFYLIKAGEFNIIFSNIQHRWFLLSNIGISLIVCGMVLRYYYIQHQWRIKIKAESQAHFQALQARIRPHFLFNSMNTIASLTRTNPQVAEEIVEDLADLFRVCLSTDRTHSSLHEEFLLIHQYLQIEKHRLGDRLSIEWNTDGVPEDAILPPMTIQPLMENAVYHGIEPSFDGGVIYVDSWIANNLIHFSVCNTVPKDGKKSQRKGNQIAMNNTRARLDSFFNNLAKLRIHQTQEGFVVEIIFPYWQSLPHENTNHR